MLSWPPQSPWCHFGATSPGRQSGSRGKPSCWCSPLCSVPTGREDRGVTAFTTRAGKLKLKADKLIWCYLSWARGGIIQFLHSCRTGDALHWHKAADTCRVLEHRCRARTGHPQGDKSHTDQCWHHRQSTVPAACCSQGMRAGSLGHLSVTILARSSHTGTAGGGKEGAGLIWKT